MKFQEFCQYLQRIEKVSSRIAMTKDLAELFQALRESASLQPVIANGQQSEMEAAAYLIQGNLLASYESLEFQLSEKMLLRALARLSQVPEENGASSLFASLDQHFVAPSSQVLERLQKRYKALGDMGELFEETLATLPKKPGEGLSILAVYKDLRQIAEASGTGSQEKKLELLVALLEKIEPLSARYLSRMILGKMRLGFATMTLLDALSWSKTASKTESADLEKAFQKKADLGKLAQSYLIRYPKLTAKELLEHYQVELGIPIVAALCQRLNSSQEIIEKMQQVYAEPKYDGLRVQIHYSRKAFADGSHCKAFTRNLENVTAMFPELSALASHLHCDSAIFDSEAIGIDKETGKFVAFQETIQRKRKHEVAAKAAELPIRFFVFDLLFLNGRSLLEEKIEERKKLLAEVLEDSAVAEKTKAQRISDPEELKNFHEAQLAKGLEGAVMKKTGSEYVPGRKGWRWVKIKEEEGSRGKLSDTIDCVMMGYYFGKGKRQSFGIGALLVGVVATDANGNLEVKSLSKIGTGLTDEQFREIKKLADQLAIQENQKPVLYQVDESLYPDRWLEPGLILEIAADEITQSPIHAAGVALRFPRLVRIRGDKDLMAATTLQELKQIRIAE